MEYTEEEWRRKILYVRQRSDLEKMYQAGAMTLHELQVDDQRLADTLEVCIVSGDPDPNAKLRKQQELEKRLSSYINLTNIARQTETGVRSLIICLRTLSTSGILSVLMTTLRYRLKKEIVAILTRATTRGRPPGTIHRMY